MSGSERAGRGGARRPASTRRPRYSGFRVGAALECADGTIVTGCNIENATYGLTVCAERVALWKALSEGRTAFVRIAVVADTDRADAAVRRVPAAAVGVLRRHRGRARQPAPARPAVISLADLLPMPFDRLAAGVWGLGLGLRVQRHAPEHGVHRRATCSASPP